MRVLLIAVAVFAASAAPAAAAPLICLDPGHARHANLGMEPIGPGSKTLKVKDPGGTAGEAEVVLQIAKRTRRALEARGFRVAMTRWGPDLTLEGGGNIARAKFCNRRKAALVIRIHADGSTSSSAHGLSTLFPAKRNGWTDDILPASKRGARLVQEEVLKTTGAKDLGLVRRSDLTGFNWSNVPTCLVETGFMTNPAERKKLRNPTYQRKIARGLANAAGAFTGFG
jgi:N-acetylmuramoyl-L-alanine amidase